MTRAQRVLILIAATLFGLLPILVYGMEHGGLVAPAVLESEAMTANQQLAQVVAGLIFKPTYMFLSLILIIALIGQTATEIASLRWGLVAFLAGETFCAINFYVYRHESLLSEYAHSFGMALAFGFLTFALLEILDKRLLHINHGRCAVNELCATCKRTSPLACTARRTAQFAVPMFALLSFLPLGVPLAPTSYATEIFGFAYSYTRFDLYQWYETRVLPLTALACFALAFLPLLRKGGDPIPTFTTILFSAGLGALGFSLFRVTLASMFRENLVWFEFWEEATELMFVAAVGFVMWQFRKTLLEQTPLLKSILENR